MAEPAHSTNVSRRLFATGAPVAALAALTARSSALPVPSPLSGLAAELRAVWAQLEVCSDDEVDDVMDRAYPIVDRIIATPCANLSDFKVKAEVVRWFYADVEGDLDEDFDGTHDLRMLGSLIRDLLAA